MANELQVRQPAETRELVRLAVEEAAGAFDGLHSIHGSIAERAFRRTGIGGAPAHWAPARLSGAGAGGPETPTLTFGRVADPAIAPQPRRRSHTPAGASALPGAHCPHARPVAA